MLSVLFRPRARSGSSALLLIHRCALVPPRPPLPLHPPSATRLRSLSSPAARLRLPQPLVICGPSGTGKSTLLNRLLAAHPSTFGFSVSHTTRKPREGEQDGVNYHFTTTEVFEGMIGRGEFIENARFSGNYYGTSAAAVAAVATQNRRCILDIDTQGVKLIKSNHPSLNPVFLFLAPPSIDALRSRLSGRGTESDESLRLRLDAALGEIRYAAEGGHDVVVVNDEVDRAYKLLEKIALGEEVEGDKLPAYEGL